MAIRGRTQTAVYLIRTLGQVVAVVIVAFGMNGPEYNGSSSTTQLTFSQVAAILAVPAACMVPVSWYGVREPTVTGRPSIGRYLSDLWSLLASKAIPFPVM